MNISLKGKRALIGGSSRGLGLAVAKQLAYSGASVTLMSRNENKLKDIVYSLEKETNNNHSYLVVDFNNFNSFKKTILSFLKKNEIDILVNNTQGPKSGDIESLLIQDYQNAFDLLFKSFVFTTISALPHMKKNNWGRITLANDVADCNITVNNILTGYFQTERIEEINLEKAKKLDVPINQIYESMKNQVPMKRIGQPEEFAYLASFLCSDKANYITGINIPIDGGLIKSL